MEFTGQEIKELKRLNTPPKVQGFINSLGYNHGRRMSVIDVHRKKKADCFEGACFAAYVLRLNGVKCFLMDLTSRFSTEDDHVVCVFRQHGCYGAVAQSKFLGLKYRNPVYKNLRELAMSYFENFFNYSGINDLYSMSVPYTFKDSDLLTVKGITAFEKKSDKVRQIGLINRKWSFPGVTREKFRREFVIWPKNVKVSKRYC